MKSYLKNIMMVSILAFAISFMLYIYEPIFTYSSNIEDFWFDFKLMLPNIVIYFVALFLGVFILYTIIYFISYLLTKKDIVFKTILALSFGAYIFTYIQGNYLIGSLPSLDGTTIDWGTHIVDNIISVSIIVVLFIIEIILIKKVKIDKTLKINKWITIATFFMLLTSLVSSLLKPGVFREKIVATATNRNINNASSNKNFFIFLADAVDSVAFSTVLNESEEYQDTFNDFTYYPDTVSAYTFTRDSMPFIFSGIWNENETEFNEYCNMAYNNSPLIKNLKDKEYDMNFYEREILWSDRNAAVFSNIDIYNDKVDKITFGKQLTKYVLFKYLPYPLKKYSRIETADFDICRIDEEGSYFSWRDDVAYENIKNNGINVLDKNYFQFLHIEGGHVPFDYDENVSIIPEEEGTYEQKLKATLNIIDAFIKRLKKYNVYDNSVIIVMADHGYWYNNNGRQNPFLYIKGIDEHHEMYTSDIPVSYEDLIEIYKDLLEDKKSTELLSNIDKNRVRRFLYNGFNGEDHMVEYEQRGKAWDKSATVETGREFNR